MSQQLFELEHLGRRRLAMLKNLLSLHYPQVDQQALIERVGIASDWGSADQGCLLAFLHCLTVLKEEHELCLGLQIGDRAQLTDSGLLGYAVLTAPTVLQAAKVTSHALNTSGYYLRTKLQLGHTHALTVFAVTRDGLPHREELLSMSVLALWRCSQAILRDGRSLAPSYVTFAFAKPDKAELYSQLFDCEVRFDSEHTVLAWPVEWMAASIPSGNAEMIDHCASELKQVLGSGYLGQGIAARVKRAMIEDPATCQFSFEGTAKKLKLKPHVLRQQLSATDTGFRDLALQVRMELAEHYLTASRLPLKAIAYQLGYDHANNFHRAFNRYFGRSAGEVRREAYATAESVAGETPLLAAKA